MTEEQYREAMDILGRIMMAVGDAIELVETQMLEPAEESEDQEE